MLLRYSKNIDEIFTENIQNILLDKNIAVIGCGGQGGYILEFLARLGVASIAFWDGDFYDETNLNRQSGCFNSTLGRNKATVLCERLMDINPTIKYYSYEWFFGDNLEDEQRLQKIDFIFYCADHTHKVVAMREILRKKIIEGVPLIECPLYSLGGWVHIDTQNDLGHFDFMTETYSKGKIASKINQSAYRCAIMAGEAVNQMVQYFANSRYAYQDATLNIDLYHHKYSSSDKFGEF